jgi:hypothetical protein
MAVQRRSGVGPLPEGSREKRERGGYYWGIDAYLKMLISPQMVVSLETSPISMKYLHNCICTTAAKYQQI